jgi:membrane protein DedA with SNARE-associated domain
MIHVLALAGGRPVLPGFLQSVAGPLDHYGIWAIALLLLLENLGVPVIPGELAMIAGAIYAGAGQLNIVAVGVASVVAAFIGSECGHAIGKFAGREVVLRYGKYILIREHHLEKAEQTVDKYGGFVVIVARYIVGLRELNGIIAGVTGMRAATFAIFNAIGAVAWVATWVSLGYLAGDHIEAIYGDITRYALYVVIAAIVLVVALIVRHLIRRRQRQPGQRRLG